MTTATFMEPAGLPLSEREWDKLTNMVLDGCVVPIVGPDLLWTSDGNGQAMSLYDVWGRALAEQSDMSLQSDVSIPLLYHVTNRLTQEQTGNDLAYDIDDVVRRRDVPIPAALRKLAQIDTIPLYVTTTIDHLLKRALDEIRPGPDGTARQILFSPRGAKAHVDLDAEIRVGDSPTVFHLFGATGPVEEGFAKTEDDLLEYSWSLLDLNYAPERLYDYLRKKTVLLIGCRFPDWLGRFLIYALHAGRREALNVYYVGDRVETGLEDFLKRRKAKILRVERATEFIDELHRRWAARRPSSSCPAERVASNGAKGFKKGAVFLSYAREDKPGVLKLKAQLEAAQIDTWMDESDLEPGVAYQDVIRDNISDAAFFIAVISRSLDSLERNSRFLWREWKLAEDVNLERRKEDCFLQPVCIDGTPAGARFVEPPYRDLHWTRLHDGRFTDEFIAMLTHGIRRFRRGR